MSRRGEQIDTDAMTQQYPELRRTVTDLLIGNRFMDRVDKVWPPMESLYRSGKQPIPAWDDPPRTGDDDPVARVRERSLPDGYQP